MILEELGQTFDGVLAGDSFSDYAFSFLKSKYLKKTQTRLNDRDFVSFGLMKNDHLTRAGLLLADENELFQSRLFCTRWNGVNKASEKEVIDDDEISGSIIKQLDAAFDFYKKIPEVIDYPMESIRRNYVIAHVFNRMNLMNKRGSSLSNITNRTNALFGDEKNHLAYTSEDGFLL